MPNNFPTSFFHKDVRVYSGVLDRWNSVWMHMYTTDIGAHSCPLKLIPARLEILLINKFYEFGWGRSFIMQDKIFGRWASLMCYIDLLVDKDFVSSNIWFKFVIHQ